MIVLDTHAWLWWNAEVKRLSVRARRAIAAEDTVGVSAISCREVAMLVAHERIVLDRDPLLWMRQALAREGTELLPLTPQIAAVSASLAIHGDQPDRMIAATALVARAGLVTKDERLRREPGIVTIW